jgi:ubiquinone/menaquinone biosynthesis C-methylase UbiE
MSLAYWLSGRNRRKKWKIFMKKIKPKADMSVLDIGYTDREYSRYDNFLEKNYPYTRKITALGVEEPLEFSDNYPEVRVVKYPGSRFPFSDKQFDIAWSNATIEHVGGFERQLEFLKEINRVAKKAFITTPNRNFPIEVHTRTPLLHFLPKDFFDKYLKFTGQEWAAGDYMNLLSLGDIKRLLKMAGIKKYKIIKNRLGFLTLDFVIILQG